MKYILLAVAAFSLLACNTPDEEEDIANYIEKAEAEAEAEAENIGSAPPWVSKPEKLDWVWRYGEPEGKPKGEPWPHGGKLFYGPNKYGYFLHSSLKINRYKPITTRLKLAYDPTDETKPYPDEFDLVWTLDVSNTGLVITDTAGKETELHIGISDGGDWHTDENYARTDHSEVYGQWGKYSMDARRRIPIESVMAKLKNENDNYVLYHRLSYRKGKPLMYQVSFNHENVTVGMGRNEGMNGTFEGPVLDGVSMIGMTFAGNMGIYEVSLSTDLKPIKPAL